MYAESSIICSIGSTMESIQNFKLRDKTRLVKTCTSIKDIYFPLFKCSEMCEDISSKRHQRALRMVKDGVHFKRPLE